MNRNQLKTILLLLLATAMLLSFAACRKQGEGDAVESADSTAEPDTQTSETLFFDVLSAGGTACNVYYPDDAEKAVTEDMVGHKLGEFALTRTFKGHAGSKTSNNGK